MKYISVDDFIKEVDGKGFDVDRAHGVQCVDGLKKFVDMVYGESNFTCGNNWANGLWLNFNTNGCSKYFKRYPFSQAKKGDWIIWDKNSKAASKSHVAMFIRMTSSGLVECFGQSQNGIKEFNTCKTYTNGILGVLRPLIYENTSEDKKTSNEPFLSKKGYLKKGDSGKNIEKICKFMHDTFSNYGKWLKLDNEKILGNYFGPILEAYIKEFQKRAKAEKKYNDAIDGCIGPKTLAALKYYGFHE